MENPTLKFVWNCKEIQITKAFLKKKNKVGTVADSKTCYKLQKSTQYGPGVKARHKDQWDRNDSSDTNPYICYQFVLNKRGI